MYGVMGRLNRGEPEMLFRAATGGLFVRLELDDIFEDVEVDDDEIPLAQALYNEWDRVMMVE